MDNQRRGQFVAALKCKRMLLGHPVMGSAGDFITVAFNFYPRAEDYMRFEEAGWTVHGHLGHNDLCLNTHDRKFFEVTFRRMNGVGPVAVPNPIEY
jgi:hypothetical protein